MKIDYISDIHINHWALFNPSQPKWKNRTKEIFSKLIENGIGEVLIIAGDFSEFNVQSRWVLEIAAEKYDRVYWTYGNHDLYLISKNQKKKYGDSIGRLNELIELTSGLNNVVPLIKSIDTYKGVTFAGDVMWYLPKTQEDWSFFKQVSNDSNYIYLNGYSKEDMVRHMWKESMDWYDSIENKEIDVMVSHVPPIHSPYSIFKPNSCYMTEVPYINAKHWVCGHTHDQLSYTKAGVNVHMNAIGYAQEYDKHVSNTIPEGKIDTYRSFGIKTFEV